MGADAVTPDIRELDARAVRASVQVVSRLTPDDLGRATPCAGWALGDLLAHMTVQHHGFAAAAAGRGADAAVWQVRPLGADPVSDYAEAAEGVVAAFGADGVLEREFSLPEIGPGARFPGKLAISFHLVDYVVHGWDVARSIGVSFEPDEDVLAAALRVARIVPDGPERLEPGAAFGPGVPAPDGAGVLDQILAKLGRAPAWPR
jgi:uncharacterized protein (TIGR03086 family)